MLLQKMSTAGILVLCHMISHNYQIGIPLLTLVKKKKCRIFRNYYHQLCCTLRKISFRFSKDKRVWILSDFYLWRFFLDMLDDFAWFATHKCIMIIKSWIKEDSSLKVKVHTFWEGHKILRNLHLTFVWHYIGQK